MLVEKLDFMDQSNIWKKKIHLLETHVNKLHLSHEFEYFPEHIMVETRNLKT